MLFILLLLQTALGAELSFSAALERAKTSPAAAAVRAGAAATVEEGRAAAAWRENPTLSAERRPDEDALSLSLPLDLAAPARWMAAREGAVAAARRAEIGEAAVAAVVAAAWLDARRGEDRAVLWGSLQGQAEALLVGARARRSAGEWTPSDLALAEADAASLLERSLRAGLEAKGALRHLMALLGEPLEPLPALAAWPALAPPPAVEPASLPAALVADLDARAAIALARAAAFDRLPHLDLEGGYVFEAAEGHHGTPGPTLGLSLELPLFAPRAAAARGATARADLAQALRRSTVDEAAALAAGAQEELRVAERVAAAWAPIDLRAAVEAPKARLLAGEISLTESLTARDRAAALAGEAIDARWRLERARLALWELAAQIPEEVRP